MLISLPVPSPVAATLDAPGHGTLFAQQLGDCHSDDCINKWYAPLLNITVVKYPHELEDMFSPARIQAKFPGMAMHLFGNSPDSANRWDFFPPERWEDKTVDMQGFGYDGRCVPRPTCSGELGSFELTRARPPLARSFYPIRTTVTNARKGYAKSGTDIMWHAHPGPSPRASARLLRAGPASDHRRPHLPSQATRCPSPTASRRQSSTCSARRCASSTASSGTSSRARCATPKSASCVPSFPSRAGPRQGAASADSSTCLCPPPTPSLPQFDSSLERKMIRKWAQALLSGCVIASDIPTDREDELRAFMIECVVPTCSRSGGRAPARG